MKMQINGYEMSFDSDTARYNIIRSDLGISLNGAGCSIETSAGTLEHGRFTQESASAGESEARLNYSGPGVGCELEFRALDCGILIQTKVKTGNNLGIVSPMTIAGEDSGLDLGGDLHKWRFMRTGYQSWSPSGSLGIMEAEPFPPLDIFSRQTMHPAYRFKPRAGKHHIDWATLICNPDNGKCAMIGFLSARRYLSVIEIEVVRGAKDRLEIRVHNDAEMTPPREGEVERDCEKLWIAFGDDPHALWEKYLDLAAKEMGARVKPEVPVGWCSWYQYFTKVAEKDVRENLDSLDKRRDELSVAMVQLDDGYCVPGDWFDWNKKFASGLPALAKSISSKGFDPGIWIAPFICARGSKLFREIPEALLRNDRGKPLTAGLNPLWKGVSFHPLDLTEPSAMDYVAKTADAVRDWGFKFLKIDFVYAALLRGKRHDPCATGLEAYRKGVETIRKFIGEDVFLLGCGAPLLPSVGLVDGMRIGTDVAPKWRDGVLRAVLRAPVEPSCENAIHGTVCRAAMHRRLWLNDPDCLMVRKRKSHLTLNEVRTLTTVIFLSSGMALLSDNLAELDPDRWDMARAVFPLLDTGAGPVDLFESANPAIYYSAPPNTDRRLLALINWSDKPAQIGVKLERLGIRSAHHAFEYWNEKYLGIVDKEVGPFSLDAHSCAFVTLVPADGAIRILSTSFHMGQGSAGVSIGPVSDAGVEIDLKMKGHRTGKVYIIIGGEKEPKSIDVNFTDAGKALLMLK